MNVPSPILSVLKHHGAQGGEGDAFIEVPPFALPTLTIPVALSEVTGGVASSNFRAESFMATFTQSRTNQGALSIDLAGLRPGLWRLHLFATAQADFLPAFTNSLLQVGLSVPQGVTPVPLLVLRSGQVNQAYQVQGEYTVSLDRNSAVAVITGETGVAEILNFHVCCLGLRIL